MAWIVCAQLLACDRPWLAWESAGNDIDLAAPGRWLKLARIIKQPTLPLLMQSNVVVNGEWRQRAVCDALAQHLAAVGVDLHSADGHMAEEHSAEDAAARARE